MAKAIYISKMVSCPWQKREVEEYDCASCKYNRGYEDHSQYMMCAYVKPRPTPVTKAKTKRK